MTWELAFDNRIWQKWWLWTPVILTCRQSARLSQVLSMSQSKGGVEQVRLTYCESFIRKGQTCPEVRFGEERLWRSKFGEASLTIESFHESYRHRKWIAQLLGAQNWSLSCLCLQVGVQTLTLMSAIEQRAQLSCTRSPHLQSCEMVKCWDFKLLRFW